MYKGDLTREQAVNIVGEEAVERVEAENCDFTSCLMPSGWEDQVEFASSVLCVDRQGQECVLRAYYYQDADSVAGVEDLSHLEWEIHGYEIT